jgi:hypothetical protein
MQQNYHVNANTNSHSRAIIHRAKTSNIALAQRFETGHQGIDKSGGFECTIATKVWEVLINGIRQTQCVNGMCSSTIVSMCIISRIKVYFCFGSDSATNNPIQK